MAENIKLILRAEDNELFTPQNYKVHPTLIENPLWPSLDQQSSLNDISPDKTLQIRLDINKVIGIHYEGETKSVSELNNQTEYDTINSLRNESISYTNILSIEDATMEYIPEHPHILEQIENIERMETEYSSKLNMLNYLVDNLYDTVYATNMHMLGRHTQIIPVNGRIYSPYDGISGTRISGYIKVENANQDITLNMILRGIPVSMRRTLTSINNGKYNYIFTYPQYLMNNVDIIQSIQYIEVNNGTGATFWYGENYDFQMANTGFDNTLNNLHIINKDTRNLSSDSETNV
jgi:hypothetical protein